MEPSTIVLRSKQGDHFEISMAAVRMMPPVKDVIHDVSQDYEQGGWPLPNVDSSTLSMVIEFCEKHTEWEGGEVDEEEVKGWECKYMEGIGKDKLLRLMLAANYLEIPKLLHLTTQTAVSWIKGKKTEEIRKIFGIKNDFTPEEEEEMRRENQWGSRY